MSYTTFADVRNLSRADWLRLRRSGIGGSDAAAVLGVNPWRGPFAVYADKLGAERAGVQDKPRHTSHAVQKRGFPAGILLPVPPLSGRHRLGSLVSGGAGVRD